MQAKKLVVSASNLNGDSYTFDVYEFGNGLIMVSTSSSIDYFHEDRDAIEAHGNDVVVAVEETEEFQEFRAVDIEKAIGLSVELFGIESVPLDKTKQLIKQEKIEKLGKA